MCIQQSPLQKLACFWNVNYLYLNFCIHEIYEGLKAGISYQHLFIQQFFSVHKFKFVRHTIPNSKICVPFFFIPDSFLKAYWNNFKGQLQNLIFFPISFKLLLPTIPKSQKKKNKKKNIRSNQLKLNSFFILAPQELINDISFCLIEFTSYILSNTILDPKRVYMQQYCALKSLKPYKNPQQFIYVRLCWFYSQTWCIFLDFFILLLFFCCGVWADNRPWMMTTFHLFKYEFNSFANFGLCWLYFI